MKSRSGGCLLVAIIVCGLALFFIWRARTPPRVGSTVPFAEVSPQEQQQRRASAKQLTDQVRSVADSARRKEHKPFTIVATEEQLNTLLQDSVRTEKFAIRDLSVGLEPQRLMVQGKVLYKGFDVVATLTGNVLAQNGRLAYQAESLQLSGVPAPDNWKDKAEQQITAKLNELLKNAPGTIDSVTIEHQKLTIQGVTE